MNKRIIGWTIVAGAAAALIGCATAPTDAEVERQGGADAEDVVQGAAARRGSTGSTRTRRRSSAPSTRPRCRRRRSSSKIEKANFASIKWPADGKYMGDWKNGEKIAQEGRGKQYSDDPKGPVGGNCYACHQLAPQEVSYGTIGPSLYQFGKIRGYNDDMRKYAYGKIWNAEAYNACSQHAALRPQPDPDRGAGQGRRRAADGPGLAGQQVTPRRSCGAAGRRRHRRGSQRRSRTTLFPRCAGTMAPEHCARQLKPHEPPRIPRSHRRGRRRRPAGRQRVRAGRRRRRVVLRRREALRQRRPAALHRLPRAADADPLSRAERQPRRGRGAPASRRTSSASTC